ncbi:hypothetical protein K438DRAFT_1846283 [Mycena galopus ATCC 62051]|nr:hypothetical protein K438DRAFT_1846283 [Mycena galopus ATCC 62051]
MWRSVSSTHLIVILSLLHFVRAQTQDGAIAGTQTSKFAITGAVIGGVLLIIALLAVALYGMDRWLARRRAAKKRGSFTRLPKAEEPYRYLMPLPTTPATPSAKDYIYEPLYSSSSPLASPSIQSSSEGSAKPPSTLSLSSVEPSHFDPYASESLDMYSTRTDRVAPPPPASPSPMPRTMTSSSRSVQATIPVLFAPPRGATRPPPRSSGRTLSQATSITLVAIVR